MSIDNISFTPTATSTANMHMNMALMSSISNGFQDKENTCDDSEMGSEMSKESRAESRLNNDHGSSVENLKEDDNIIPWRAQLRKTNSRLSLIG